MKLISSVSGSLYSSQLYNVNPGYNMRVLLLNKKYYITIYPLLDIKNQPKLMYVNGKVGIGFAKYKTNREKFEEFFDYSIHALKEIQKYIEEEIAGWEII